MKDPKDFETYLDLPLVFHDAIGNRIGELEQVTKLSRRAIVKEQVAWSLGTSEWYDTFEYWLNKAGLEIVEKTQP